jgi:ATP-dependent Clp protease ATP-binding subunit ClpA
MFERFTAGARETVIAAQAEARDLGHTRIGTEHELLGLLVDRDGPVAVALREDGVDARFVRAEIVRRVGPPPADPGPLTDPDEEDAAALRAIGIDLDAVRAAIEENFGAGALRLPRDEPATPKRKLFGRSAPGRSGHIPFSPRAKKVLELALREAMRLHQNFIAPEHLMLGILRENGGLAVLILAEKNVDFDRLRTDLTKALNDRAA